MENQQPASERKRQQISRASRVMFLWIAGVSVIVGISIVLIVFLVQKIAFGEKVLAEKNKTVSVLEKNIKAVDALKENIRVLNTNEALASTKLNEDDEAVQSILDALPADGNTTALASSLQTKLLAGIAGVQLETINVDSVTSDDTDSKDTSSVQKLNFAFSVSVDAGNYEAFAKVLERLEQSIRPFTITGITIEAQGKRVVVAVSGVSYYNPAQTVELSEKVVKP